jgi:phosphate transport system substrate-binding protein
MSPVLADLSEEFQRRHPNVYFDIRGGGSRFGEEQALAGRLNLGATTFPPPVQDLTDSLQARSPIPTDADLVRIPIGIDALALVVHASNPVEMLSTEQLIQIFNGRILDWTEVGGTPGEITLISREEGSGARHLFEERIMGREPVALTAIVMPTSRDVAAYVSKTPHAIGYVSRAYVLDNLPEADTEAASAQSNGDALSLRVVALDGMWPVDAALQNQIYALSYPIYLVSRREPTGPQREFIDFALSPAGQTIVGRYHVRVR